MTDEERVGFARLAVSGAGDFGECRLITLVSCFSSLSRWLLLLLLWLLFKGDLDDLLVFVSDCGCFSPGFQKFPFFPFFSFIVKTIYFLHLPHQALDTAPLLPLRYSLFSATLQHSHPTERTGELTVNIYQLRVLFRSSLCD